MKRLITLFVCLGVSFACVDDGVRLGSPHWNKTVCSRCRMALTVPSHAAQIVGPGTQIHYFDDLGCAVAYQKSHPRLREGKIFVVAQDGWIEATKARFKDGAETPMGYGIIPAKAGTLTFEDARTLLLERTSRHRARETHPAKDT
ncbi:MAG: hypothetical protein ACFB9M_12365 [Myxococcota bacterium]